MSVPIDTIEEIKELSSAGHGRNQISALTGINPSTVRNILGDKQVEVCSSMTNRQRTDLLMAWAPPGGR